MFGKTTLALVYPVTIITIFFIYKYETSACEPVPQLSKFCLDERDCCEGKSFILFTRLWALLNTAKICPATVW